MRSLKEVFRDALCLKKGMRIKMKIKLFDKNCIPFKRYTGDAGWDLKARIPQKLVLYPLKPVTVPTGVAVEIPFGYVGDIRPRSGLAKKGVTVQYGTIDATYRGEIEVTLINLSDTVIVVEPYERIAQLVVTPILDNELLEVVESLSETERGADGFGSTGRF